ncbi:MAG: class I SAM-dependent methyltransferase [Rubrobacter sp.]|nr:class I SAM-dependent methyltransferase [Actinomycetota bacterium]
MERRHGGDPEDLKATMDFLAPVRDRVLGNADLMGGETLLDIGAGDGLIAFGALELVGEDGRVIFSDISRKLLDHTRSLAGKLGALDRCEFVRASADDLAVLEDAAVDVVTTRSVLIYVKDKRRAFEEFHRVLKPWGRLSIFEPINNFTYPEPPHLFGGADVTPVADLAERVKAVYASRQPPEESPMLDFDERDLFDLAERAGFEEIHLSYEAKTAPGNVEDDARGWETALQSAPNPLAPTLGEAMAEALTEDESERFTAHLRPLVESGQRRSRDAVAYLWTVKRAESS